MDDSHRPPPKPAEGNDVSGWEGALASVAQGYLGVRFYIQDELHYGWIHTRMSNPGTNSLESSPVILDWAYETRPNTPIAAAAVPLAELTVAQTARPGNLRLLWPLPEGAAYQMQFKDQIEAPDWTNLDFKIIATAIHTAIEVPMRGAMRFYRAVRTD